MLFRRGEIIEGHWTRYLFTGVKNRNLLNSSDPSRDRAQLAKNPDQNQLVFETDRVAKLGAHSHVQKHEGIVVNPRVHENTGQIFFGPAIRECIKRLDLVPIDSYPEFPILIDHLRKTVTPDRRIDSRAMLSLLRMEKHQRF